MEIAKNETNIKLIKSRIQGFLIKCNKKKEFKKYRCLNQFCELFSQNGIPDNFFLICGKSIFNAFIF